MSKNKKRISFITLLIALSILSGIITYRIVIGKSSEKPAAQLNNGKDNAVNELDKEENIKYKESDIRVNDVFNETEKLHLKNKKKYFIKIFDLSALKI